MSPALAHNPDRALVSPHAVAPAYAKSWAHRLSLFAVWVTFALSGIVFSEPAPFDALMIGLMILLPAVGLTMSTPATLVYMTLWTLPAAGGLLACLASQDFADSATFTAVSIYLTTSSVVIAAFVARRPLEHAKLIMNGYLMAALLAAAAGFIGYFNALPGAFDMFTKFGRATGTFKDPNVFGTFLIPPTVYALHLAMERPLRRALLPLMASAILAFAVLLSFSRGAWMALAIAVVGYAYLTLITSSSQAQRLKIAGLAGAAVILAAVGLVAAMQIDSIANLLHERAAVTQSYDVGPEGRFGGQEKAIDLILDNPIGIGAKQFSPVYHHEEVHNIYLSIMLNAGWLGGAGYVLVVALAVVLGATRLLHPSPVRPLYQLAYVCFLAIALEGFIIDTDHWRHFYLLLALMCGLGAVGRGAPAHA